jgi:hypothetical protein
MGYMQDRGAVIATVSAATNIVTLGAAPAANSVASSVTATTNNIVLESSARVVANATTVGGANTLGGMIERAWLGEEMFDKDAMRNDLVWGAVAGGGTKMWDEFNDAAVHSLRSEVFTSYPSYLSNPSVWDPVSQIPPPAWPNSHPVFTPLASTAARTIEAVTTIAPRVQENRQQRMR